MIFQIYKIEHYKNHNNQVNLLSQAMHWNCAQKCFITYRNFGENKDPKIWVNLEVVSG